MPNNYSRNTYDRHPDKINRIHLCPFSGDYVMPFVDGRGAQYLGHCPKCGTVTYVSMPETVTHEFTSYFKAQATDPRIARRDAILAAFRDEPLSKAAAAELYSELAEIDQALQFHPSDTCQAYISAAWDKMEPIPF